MINGRMAHLFRELAQEAKEHGVTIQEACNAIAGLMQPFSNIKKDEYVLLRNGAHHQVKKVTKDWFMLDGWGCDSNARYTFDGINLYDDFKGSHDIIEILNPKAVILDLGNGIKGRIEIANGHVRGKVISIRVIQDDVGKTYCQLAMSMIAEPMKTKILNLLAAQFQIAKEVTTLHVHYTFNP